MCELEDYIDDRKALEGEILIGVDQPVAGDRVIVAEGHDSLKDLRDRLKKDHDVKGRGVVICRIVSLGKDYPGSGLEYGRVAAELRKAGEESRKEEGTGCVDGFPDTLWDLGCARRGLVQRLNEGARYFGWGDGAVCGR